MTANLAIWQSLERTDPKHVKPITGKSYQGNSPKPHYVIWRLTERFGPVGVGFGWNVIREGYVPGIPHQDGAEQLHECHILFWWRDGGERGEVESFGGTKALYKAKQGYWVSDEDAAKKSLTDAITKAASWLGVAGDIFMGRWDDSKYVDGLKAEARNPVKPPIEDVRQAFRDSVALGAAKKTATDIQADLSRPVEPPHDPETGEVNPDAWRNGAEPVKADHDDMAEDSDPTSVKDFIAVIKEMAGPGATREQLEARYAAEVIANLSRRKSSVKAARWFEIFCNLHEAAIARIKDQALRSQVRSAIALKQAQINGEKVDEAEFGHPFGVPDISERMVETGSFGG
jgi:hypothetical protein